MVAAVAALCYAWYSSRRKHLPGDGLAVFISGCDSGIGRRLALYFAEQGMQVFAGCLDAEGARRTLPPNLHVVPLDVTDEGSVRSAVNTVQTILKQNEKELWCLINNAGVCVFGELEWQTWAQCEKQVQVNILGTIRMTKAFIPLLRSSKGRIVTVSSVNGLIAYPGLSIYSATKFALEGLNNAARIELTEMHGIRLITVQPGDYARLTSIMDGHEQHAREMWDNMTEEDQTKYGNFFRAYHERVLKNYGLTSPDSFEKSNLLKDMKEAVLGVSPRSKYISASFGLRIVYLMAQMAPSSFTDFLLWLFVKFFFNSRDC